MAEWREAEPLGVVLTGMIDDVEGSTNGDLVRARARRMKDVVAL